MSCDLAPEVSILDSFVEVAAEGTTASAATEAAAAAEVERWRG
mgnify:CR=1 FL=1